MPPPYCDVHQYPPGRTEQQKGGAGRITPADQRTNRRGGCKRNPQKTGGIHQSAVMTATARHKTGGKGAPSDFAGGYGFWYGSNQPEPFATRSGTMQSCAGLYDA